MTWDYNGVSQLGRRKWELRRGNKVNMINVQHIQAYTEKSTLK